jgi:hypothetical protein
MIKHYLWNNNIMCHQWVISLFFNLSMFGMIKHYLWNNNVSSVGNL